MKIVTKQIPTEGMRLSEIIEPQKIGLGEEDLKFFGPLEIEGVVGRAGNTVSVNLSAKTKLSLFCFRCLEPVEYDQQEELKFSYPVENNTEFIEIDEDIRQELILNLPLKILCRQECKGLCPNCGVNLNTEECICSKEIK